MRFVIIAIVLLFTPLGVSAQSYSDVEKSREDYIAIEDLTTRGIFEGRPDGTFGPDDFVNRAEAITITVRAVANERNLPNLKNCFPDVHGSEWYVKPVCYAKDLGWIAGYPDGTFQPVKTVAKAEFLKILLNAYGVNVDVLDDFLYPLAQDAQSSDEWYFPYLRYAIGSSMTSIDSFNNLNPGSALTRGQVAMLTYRYLLFREGVRNQPLLTNAERDIRMTFSALDAVDVASAEYSAARALVAAHGVAIKSSGVVVVDATVGLTDALITIVKAYKAVKSGDLQLALTAAQDAYHKADATDAIGGDVKVYTDRIRSYAHELADEIRDYEE